MTQHLAKASPTKCLRRCVRIPQDETIKKESLPLPFVFDDDDDISSTHIDDDDDGYSDLNSNCDDSPLLSAESSIHSNGSTISSSKGKTNGSSSNIHMVKQDSLNNSKNRLMNNSYVNLYNSPSTSKSRSKFQVFTPTFSPSGKSPTTSSPKSSLFVPKSPKSPSSPTVSSLLVANSPSTIMMKYEQHKKNRLSGNGESMKNVFSGIDAPSINRTEDNDNNSKITKTMSTRKTDKDIVIGASHPQQVTWERVLSHGTPPKSPRKRQSTKSLGGNLKETKKINPSNDPNRPAFDKSMSCKNDLLVSPRKTTKTSREEKDAKEKKKEQKDDQQLIVTSKKTLTPQPQRKNLRNSLDYKKTMSCKTLIQQYAVSSKELGPKHSMMDVIYNPSSSISGGSVRNSSKSKSKKRTCVQINEICNKVYEVEPYLDYANDLWWTADEFDHCVARQNAKIIESTKLYNPRAKKYITTIITGRQQVVQTIRKDESTNSGHNIHTISTKKISSKISNDVYRDLVHGIRLGFHGLCSQNHMDHVPNIVQKVLETYESTKKVSVIMSHHNAAKLVQSRYQSLSKADRTWAAILGQACHEAEQQQQQKPNNENSSTRNVVLGEQRKNSTGSSRRSLQQKKLPSQQQASPLTPSKQKTITTITDTNQTQ